MPASSCHHNRFISKVRRIAYYFVYLYDVFVTKVGMYSCCSVANSVYTLLCMTFALSPTDKVHHCEMCCKLSLLQGQMRR